jgi:hypothetical protein
MVSQTVFTILYASILLAAIMFGPIIFRPVIRKVLGYKVEDVETNSGNKGS